jgi:hypothetical protein
MGASLPAFFLATSNDHYIRGIGMRCNTFCKIPLAGMMAGARRAPPGAFLTGMDIAGKKG